MNGVQVASRFRQHSGQILYNFGASTCGKAELQSVLIVSIRKVSKIHNSEHERTRRSSTRNSAGEELGSASERAKGRGAVWAKSGHSAQYYYHMLSARLGMGEGRKGKRASAGSRA